jgi:hypothetical protein
MGDPVRPELRRVRYFLDTEFVEDGETIMPISLALVEDTPPGCRQRELYLEFDFDQEKAEAHDFVRENVLPHLAGQERYTRDQAARRIKEFVLRPGERPQFWAWYASYDWVLFAQIFGPMHLLPDGLPHLCMDLQQLWLTSGRRCPMPPQPANQHHALADARWNLHFFRQIQASIPPVLLIP